MNLEPQQTFQLISLLAVLALFSFSLRDKMNYARWFKKWEADRKARRDAELANRREPVLHTHDRYGNRIDEVVYDPAYHRLMQVAVEHGLHAAPWAETDPNAHLVRAAKANAALAARTFVTPQDIADVIFPVWRHRLHLTPQALSRGASAGELVDQVLRSTPQT